MILSWQMEKWKIQDMTIASTPWKLYALSRSVPALQIISTVPKDVSVATFSQSLSIAFILRSADPCSKQQLYLAFYKILISVKLQKANTFILYPPVPLFADTVLLVSVEHQMSNGVQSGSLVHKSLQSSMSLIYCTELKGQAISLHGWTGPEGSRRLRLQDFKAICT